MIITHISLINNIGKKDKDFKDSKMHKHNKSMNMSMNIKIIKLILT